MSHVCMLKTGSLQLLQEKPTNVLLGHGLLHIQEQQINLSLVKGKRLLSSCGCDQEITHHVSGSLDHDRPEAAAVTSLFRWQLFSLLCGCDPSVISSEGRVKVITRTCIRETEGFTSEDESDSYTTSPSNKSFM